MPKLGDKSEAFVKKAFEIANHSSNLLPKDFLDEITKDAQLRESLAPIQTAIDLLQKQLDDTVLQLGAEAYAGARTVEASLSKIELPPSKGGAFPANSEPPPSIGKPPPFMSEPSLFVIEAPLVIGGAFLIISGPSLVKRERPPSPRRAPSPDGGV